MVIAIDIASCRPLSEFNADMEQMIADLKEAPRQRDVPEIFYPGEREARSDERLRKEGIALPEETVRELRENARSLGIDAPF